MSSFATGFSKNKSELISVGDKINTSTINAIVENINEEDVTLNLLKKKLSSRNENERISYNSNKIADQNDSIMISIEDLRNNNKNINTIRNAFDNGTKIYIYGGVSTKEYIELLNINGLKDTVNINGKNENVYIGYVKGGKKVQNDIIYDVIGYGKDEINDGLSIYNLSLVNDDGEELKPTNEIYARTILEDFYKIDDNKEIRKNRAITGAGNSTIVASSSRKQAHAYYKASGTTIKAGTIYGDYKLLKANNDKDSNYDYFAVTNHGDVGNGPWYCYNYWVDIDVPSSVDYLEKWGPLGTSSTSSFSFSISYPWSASFSFSTDVGKLKVNDLTNRPLDYARWEMSKSSLNGLTFDPVAAWKSKGTYARVDIRQRAKFEGGYRKTSVELKIPVTYDY